ncbi:hypothetical protein D3C75_558560 [compost metagenome]
MSKADASGIFRLVAREADGICIAVPLHKHVQFITHGPRIHPQLIEQLIDRKIERIHHPVFAFVHDPERFILVIKQLGRAVIAADRMGKHKDLVFAEP